MKTLRRAAFFALIFSMGVFISACDSSDGGVVIPPDTGSGDDNTGGGDTGDAVKLVFVGDTMLARKVKRITNEDLGGDYTALFRYTADYLKSADLTFTNLESMISDTGTVRDITLTWMGIAFRAEPAAINGLTYAGIDIVSVANNHAFDYSRPAFEDCLARLTAAGITPVGGGTFEQAYTAKIFEVKETKIAYLAFTLRGPESLSRARKEDAAEDLAAQTGVAWYYTEYVNPAVRQARLDADLVVVSIHFGEEYETEQDSDQEEVAHNLIDQGAGLVVGHHPHVVQPLESYGGGYIAYSLGNFIFDQSDQDTHRGMVLEVTVSDKKIESVTDKYIDIDDDTYQPVMQ